jgi:flagellin
LFLILGPGVENKILKTKRDGSQIKLHGGNKMRIQHNLNAMNSLRQLGANNTNTGKNLEKLSSGYRINRAGDDAAGLAISEKMRGQINGLEQAEQNANDGISLIQTAEGGLNETHAILQRMREIAVQSSNGTYQNEVDRTNLNKEVDALKKEIDRISSSTHFNKIDLLKGSISGYTVADGTVAESVASVSVSGGNLPDTTSISITVGVAGATLTVGSSDASATSISFTADITNVKENGTYTLKATANADATVEDAAKWDGVSITVTIGALSTGAEESDFDLSGGDSSLTFQIGANGSDDQKVSLTIGNMSSEGLEINDISVATQDSANSAIEDIDNAINKVSATRADLGALQNRLEHTVNNLGVTNENLTAAESRIRDVDMAKEMMEYTKNNILSQAAQAMLAQANQQPQGVLQLLQ